MPEGQCQGRQHELMEWFERQPKDRQLRIDWFARSTGQTLPEVLQVLKAVDDQDRSPRLRLVHTTVPFKQAARSRSVTTGGPKPASG